MTGTIFDIKRFSIHDGPGIRTTVFLKGCPLQCIWCHNPEGISPGKDLWVKPERCIKCGDCVAACKFGALSLVESGVAINHSLCTYCDDCVDDCPTGAIQRVDKSVTPHDLALELAKDKLFFQVSGGGVTLSGGEPLDQPDFLHALLGELRAMEIHTCIETSFMAPKGVVSRILPLVDHVLADIKLIDPQEHTKYIGDENTVILDNLKLLGDYKGSVTVRTPLIPGITATTANLRSIGQFVAEFIPKANIELINYNSLAPNKYPFLDQVYFDGSLAPFSDAEIDQFYATVRGNNNEA